MNEPLSFAERVDQAFGRHNLDAIDKVKKLGLAGSDADKVFVEAQINALKDVVAEVAAEIEKLRASL